MKSRFAAQNDFYENPSKETLLELKDILHYYAVRGTMTREVVDNMMLKAHEHYEKYGRV